jgi:hypothetical protein
MIPFQSDPLYMIKKKEAVPSDGFLLESDYDIAKFSPEKCAPFGIERFCLPLPMHHILEFHCALCKEESTCSF